ncbi:hypothetical protein D3C75_1363990 [compost metagenome]
MTFWGRKLKLYHIETYVWINVRVIIHFFQTKAEQAQELLLVASVVGQLAQVFGSD